MKKGKLIVIDGGDGSGKGTQAELLVEYLKKNHKLVSYYDFPRYYDSFYGEVVAKLLRGEFGTLKSISPYLASLAYALDRASVKDEMHQFLKKNGYIISNRYASSNMAHQGAKFTNEKKRKEFLKWVNELEYTINEIPKEDLVIYLYVPWQIGLKLTGKKIKREYLKGKKNDIAEKDIDHRKASEKMYLQLQKSNKNWVRVDCVDKSNNLKTREEIFENIIAILKKRKYI